jgi:hypothetical protein
MKKYVDTQEETEERKKVGKMLSMNQMSIFYIYKKLFDD